MEEQIDPYERQLLAVFKSCDSDGKGILDRSSFDKLCQALQLEEIHLNHLMQYVFESGKCDVTFAEFRDALLKVLASLKSPTNEYPDLHNSDYGVTVLADEEVTPKLIIGGKKYGRRSRPISDQEEESGGEYGVEDTLLKSESTKSEDEINRINEEESDFEIETLCNHLGVCRKETVSTPALVSICNTLGIPSSVFDMIQQNITKLKAHAQNIDLDPKADFTYGDFFNSIKILGLLDENSRSLGILDRCMSTSFNEDGISISDINRSGCINYDTLVYLLENSGIVDAGMFLNDLGVSPQFDVNLSELADQLQEELINVQRCMDNSSNQMHTLMNPHLLLLQASVVVSQAQIKWYRSCMEQKQCERNKLRNDLLVANERATLLAQEVDDNHACLENSVQQKLKLLELKHAEQIKKLTYQWSTEREQLTNQNIKMEKQLEQLLHDETKLRSEVASLKQDYENMEKENRNLLDQLANAENVNDDLEREIQRLSLLKKKVLELESSNEQAISFLEKMNRLQAENIMLRDKNDELASELESITLRQMQNRGGCSKRRGNSPLEGEDYSDTDIAATTHRMYSKVRKYSTEKDLSTGFDSAQYETLNSSLMAHCESGIEADLSTSCSSLDRIGVANNEANEKVIPELKSRVSFLENVIRKIQVKVPDCYDDSDITKPSTDLNERSTSNLEKQCETLQLRLDQVQIEILKLLSERRACTEENCVLKMRISELMKQVSPSSDANLSLDTIRNDSSWSSHNSSEGSSQSETLKAVSPSDKEILDDAEALRYVEKNSRMTKENSSLGDPSGISDRHSVQTETVNTSCSNMFAAVSEGENEMDWKTFGNERKSSGSMGDAEADREESHLFSNYEKMINNYIKLTDENKSLKEKCEDLSSCLEMLRNEYDQCEEYWVGKLDDERKLYEEEQRVSDEKFDELHRKIEEYTRMFDAESMSSHMGPKLPPIAENDKLEKEVNDLQEEFRLYKQKMELENQEKQDEIERLTQIIRFYDKSGLYKHSGYITKGSLENLKNGKTCILEQSSLNLEVPRVEECSSNVVDAKCVELKQRKRQLKRECEKLEREKELLIDQATKVRSESRTSYNMNSCTHSVQQHNAEVSKNSILLRLRYQEMKNRHLRNQLLQQQKKFTEIMKEIKDQHENELVKYRSALTSSQEMWQSLQETSKKQAEQIAISDVLVKELYCENSQLMATIHQLEQQHLDCPSVLL